MTGTFLSAGHLKRHDRTNRASYRKNWWIHGEPRANLRPALEGLERFIATVETLKHRFFTFLDKTILPDNRLVNIALEDGFSLVFCQVKLTLHGH